MKMTFRSAVPAFVSVIFLMLGCTLASTSAPLSSNTDNQSNTPIPATKTPISLDHDWLITEKELEEISGSIGIENWQRTRDIPGENRICRDFSGSSLSSFPNFAENCINKVDPDISFEEVIDFMYDLGALFPTDIELTPTLSYDHDFALYTFTTDTYQFAYLALLRDKGLLFRASFSVGNFGSLSPEILFDEHGEIFETVLKDILMINLDKVGGDSNDQ